MIDRMPSRSTCWHLCQLEVCKLLQYGDQVVYSEGLNGDLEPVQTSLSEPIPPGSGCTWQLCLRTSILTGGPLQGDTGRPYAQSLSPLQNLNTIFPSHLTTEHLPKTDSHISMTAEFQELLSQAMLHTFSKASGNYILMEANICSPGGSTPYQNGDSSKPVVTLMTLCCSARLLRWPALLTSPPTMTPSGADMGIPPAKVIQLQKEMNMAMGWLLMTRASIDTHCRKQVSDFKMAFHQNEALTTEAIREVKACCGAAIRENRCLLCHSY